jgi:hypothetical protein
MSYRITTQKQLRDEFWETFPELECRVNHNTGNPLRQNKQPVDTRMSFVDWIDQLQRNGDIPEKLAERATL